MLHIYFDFSFQKFEEDLREGRKPENEDSDDDLKPVKKRQFKSRYQKKKYLHLKKKKKQQPNGLPKAKKRKLDKRQKELAQKRTLAVDHMVRRVTAAAGVPRSSVVKPSREGQVDGNHGFEVSPISQKKKPNIASKAFVNNFTVEVASEVKKRKTAESTNKTSKKKCFDVSVLDLQSSGGTETNTLKENGKVYTSVSEGHTQKKKTKMADKVQKANALSTCNGEVLSITGQKQSVKGEKLVGAQKNVEKVDKQNMQTSSDKATQGIITKATDNASSENKVIVINFSESQNQKGQGSVTPQNKSPWNEPLKKGEYEVFIKSRKQVKKTKEKKISPIKVSCIHSCCQTIRCSM